MGKKKSGEKTIHSVWPQNSVLEVESSCRNKSDDFSMVMTFKLENLYMPLHRVWHLCINSSDNRVVNNSRDWLQEGLIMLNVLHLLFYMWVLFNFFCSAWFWICLTTNQKLKKTPNKQTKLFLIIAPEMPHLINALKSHWVDFLFRSHEGNS